MGDLSDAAKQVYTVESISDQREINGRTEYFIKWKGWSARFSTWEPTDNILDPKLIDDFNRRRSNKLAKSQQASNLEGTETSREPLDAVNTATSSDAATSSKTASANKRRLSNFEDTRAKKPVGNRNAERNKQRKIPGASLSAAKPDGTSAAESASVIADDAAGSSGNGSSSSTSQDVNGASLSALPTDKSSVIVEEPVQKASEAIKQHEKAALRKVQLPYPFDEMKDDDDGIHPDAVQYFVIPRSDGTTFRVRMCKNKNLLLRTRKRAR